MGATERHVLADHEALARHAAEFLVERLAAAAGEPAVALSGGTTPKRLYELLATPEYRDRLPWERVHWFFGDERFVPPDDPESNYRMARLALFAAVKVPPAHLHPMPTVGLTPEQAAAAYEETLQRYYGATTLDPGRPLFEVNLLGLGEDGHTASLFPGTAALLETVRWAVSVIGAKPEPRLTLTYPALDSSRHSVFLIEGAAKHPVLERLARGDDLPAGRIRPTGTLHWMLDRAAAGEPLVTEDPMAALKRVAAERAVAEVETGMVLGLGTGSTAALAADAVGRRVREEGLGVIAIPTSERTAAQAAELGIPLSDLARHGTIDLTIDGADAVERGSLTLIKGLGGALLREKIVAAASRRMVVIVDESKLRGPLGSFCPVPVEVVRFGWTVTRGRLEREGCEATLRLGPDGEPFVTDGGNFILDCAFGAIADAAALEPRLKHHVGVVETGLFVGMAAMVIVASPGGIDVLRPG